MSRRIYFAARMSRQFEMQGYRADLARHTPHQCVSRWIDERRKSPEDEVADSPMIARRDVDDLMLADTVCLFGEPEYTKSHHGRLTELGIGIGLGLTCFVVGPEQGRRDNVFCYLPEVKFFPHWHALLACLKAPEMAHG